MATTIEGKSDYTITTEGGQKIHLTADTASSDYFVLNVSDLDLKLTRNDLIALRAITLNMGGAAMNAK